jgi:hypothetical protein
VKTKNFRALAIGSLLFCLSVGSYASIGGPNRIGAGVKFGIEQGTTQPISLKSISAPNSSTNNPGVQANWVLEIKARADLLAAGATVKVEVRQLGDPATLSHKVSITNVNSSAIVFGPSVQGIRTVSVTVPIEAQGASQGGVFGVSLEAVATITEAQTANITKSTVAGNYNFLFPQTNGLVGGGEPEANVPVFATPAPPPPPIRRVPRPRLFVENYYDWYVGLEPTQRQLNGKDDDE